ncbi:MAG: co-chaperone GroES [Phycisphaerales bacterium]|nr:co-chaperone GroES [Phycisphaerales bacterium]
MKVRPLGDKIIIKRAEAETKTDAGIFLPESAKDRPKQGTVEAIGTGKINEETGDRIPMNVAEGDQVIFTVSYPGPEEIKIDDQEYLIMNESAVLAIID